jgi:hypothetical protein
MDVYLSEKLKAKGVKSFASGMRRSGIETIICPTLKILRESLCASSFFVVKKENGMIKNIFPNFQKKFNFPTIRIDVADYLRIIKD